MRPMIGLALLAFAGAGCSVVPVNVSNPIPGMTKVAVAPFLNLSAEPSVDGRRFAISYYSELQKTSNYEVLPIGVVELAIRENELMIANPDDVIKLAQILDVDAIVVGAVTEYVPYYPPQLAVQIDWYSPRGWMFATGESSPNGGDPCSPGARAVPNGGNQSGGFSPNNGIASPPVVRGQSADDDDDDSGQPFPPPRPVRLAQAGTSRSREPDPPPVWPADAEPGVSEGEARSGAAARAKSLNNTFCSTTQPDNLRPIMSYTRFFDGASPELIHRLKGYYVRRGDMRSGGWEAYLHRSDDFLRFASHVLVIEMLALHGGSLTTEKVFLFGK
ncbi:MAG TPA: hypothetical protein VGM05_23450 [Planctomycetaceae bacterium]